MAQAAALLVDSLPGAPVEEDAELISAVRRGDDRAFERLYQRYHRRISAYVRGMVSDHARAEDVTQEVFLSALRRLRGSDQTIVFKPWLYEIARNACIDQYRRAQRTPEISYEADTAAAHLVACGPSPEAAVDTKKQLDDLRHALRGLSGIQHDILVMREFEGLSYREIGERMSLTKPAVESALFRARRRLQEEYDALASGERCLRVQQAILAVCEGSAGVRDRWSIATHVPHCAMCRRHARLAGLTHASLPRRVAALLPLPWFARRLPMLRSGDRVQSLPGGRGSAMAQWATTLSGATDSMAGLMTAGAAATLVLALGGVGVGVAHSGDHDAQPRARHASAPTAPPSAPAITAPLVASHATSRTGAAIRRGGARLGNQRPAAANAPSAPSTAAQSSPPASGPHAATDTGSTSPASGSAPPARHSSGGHPAQQLIGGTAQKAGTLTAAAGTAGAPAQGAAAAGQSAVDTVSRELPPAAADVAQSVPAASAVQDVLDAAHSGSRNRS